MKNKRGFTVIEGLVLLSILTILGIIIFALVSPKIFGTYPFGPKQELTVTVNRLYVDFENKSSHYMIGTDKGVMEVDNSWYLSIYNADEIYSSLEPGKTYKVIIKGNRIVTWWAQEFPGIISVKPFETTEE